tara:strand:+ start:9056 stop:9583 length:528 start_codon:yes stop_codon:yes gene_type:complete
MPKKTRFKKTFSFKKLANKLENIIINDLNSVGNWLNKSIQDGIIAGKDIDGKPFRALEETTGSMRIAKQGYYKKSGGGGILDYSGNMKKTKKIPAKTGNLRFILEMVGKNKAGKVYGAFHNTGFNQDNPKQWFYGSKVEKRKWFGITKKMYPGGSDYKKATKERSFRIKMAFKDA